MASEGKKKDPDTKLEKSKDGDEKPEKKGKLRWILGWIVLPGSFLSAIFLAGVHVGARHPDMWLSEFFHWLFS